MTAAKAPDLGDIQGNILRGYRHGHAAHVFVAVGAGAAPAARRLVGDLIPQIWSAAPWHPRQVPHAPLNLAFTHHGLAALAPDHAWSEPLPAAFCADMSGRAELLGDHDESAPEHWEPGLRAGEADILLTRYAPSAADRDRLAEELAGEVSGRPGLRVAHLERTDALGQKREHFGFEDGFSQPAVAGSGRTPRGEGVRDRLGWRPVRLGEFILGHRDEDGYVPGAGDRLLHNGTYMVWRKLAQDVDAFERWLAGAAGGDGDAARRLAWQIVGRRADGSSLMRAPVDGPQPPQPDNDFGYAEDPHGRRCPLGAHVRRANPRDALGWRTERTKRHRLIRRGMSYGAGGGPGERGLVFVGLNASLERQFEFIQSAWLGDGSAFGLGEDPDLLVGGAGPQARMTIQGDPPRFVERPRRFVTTRGGHYLFVPGLRALERLAAG